MPDASDLPSSLQLVLQINKSVFGVEEFMVQSRSAASLSVHILCVHIVSEILLELAARFSASWS